MRIGLLQNRLLFNMEIIFITGLLIFEKPNYDKIFVANYSCACWIEYKKEIDQTWRFSVSKPKKCTIRVRVKKWSKLTIFALKTWKIYDIRHIFVGCRIECEAENNQSCLFCQRAIRAKTLEWRGGSRIEPRKTGLRGRKILNRAEKCVTWC